MERTVVALYVHRKVAFRVVQALREAGLSADCIRLAAPDVVEQPTQQGSEADPDVTGSEGLSFGGFFGGLIGVLVGLVTIYVPGVGPIITAGALAVVLGSVVGGLVGALAGAVTGGVMAALIRIDTVPTLRKSTKPEKLRVTVCTAEIDEALSVMSQFAPVHLENTTGTLERAEREQIDPFGALLSPSES